MAIIRKKCWPEWFEKFCSGERTFELRLADFDLKNGDILVFEEYNPETKQYTDRRVSFQCKKVEHSAQDPLQFYNVDDVRKYGFWIIELEPKANVAEPTFKPKDGQIDYTNIRYAPVINCVVRYNDIILIMQRNSKMRLYPNFWNGISGFLDDGKSIEQKVIDELWEELGIEVNDIISIYRGPVFNQEEEKYNKTWIVHPILVDVKTDKIKLNWEAQNYKWIKVKEAKTFDLLPGFDKVLTSFFTE